jgi:hypothetical protein
MDRDHMNNFVKKLQANTIKTNCVAQIAHKNDRTYITPEDVTEALKTNDENKVLLDVMEVFANVSGFGVEDQQLTAQTAYLGHESDKITKQKYEAAKKIVAQYEKDEQQRMDDNLPALRKDLEAYFKEDNKLKASAPIYQFDLVARKNYNDFRAVIFPTKPWFDEDYHDTPERDKFLTELGKKHGYSDCGVDSNCFGK